MYCSRLLILQEILTPEQIEKLNDFLGGLIGGAKATITISKIAGVVGIPSSLATKVLTKCKEEGVVDVSYSIRCPECGMRIKKVDSLVDIPDEPFECYSCNEEIEIDTKNIELLYSIKDDSVFLEGQQSDDIESARTVVPEDTMAEIFKIGDINEYLFHPTDEEYLEIERRYNAVLAREGTTKDVGDTLESLIAYLFSLCPIFCVAGIRTSTNQIDCCVRNKMYLKHGILEIIGARFFIECKNEATTPSGGYLSKFESIISFTNAGGKGNCIKFGIIVSKKRGPATFKKLAVKEYLSKGVILISICGDEIKELYEKKGNLLEIIERKATEIMMDAETDLVEVGLFGS